MSTAATRPPAFVPRTVALAERAATQLARRHQLATPGRSVWRNALAFTDRLLGQYFGRDERGGLAPATLGAAHRIAPATLTLPRPWYDLDEQPAFSWPLQDASLEASVAATVRRAESPAAERGAAIEKTALTVAPEPTVRSAQPEPTVRTAQPEPTVRTAAEPTVRAAAPEPVVAGAAQTTVQDRAPDPTEPSVVVSPLRELRAAEIVAMSAPEAPAPVPRAQVPALRRETALTRSLGHAAWVDARLTARSPEAAAPPERERPASLPGYVWVAAPGSAGPREAEAVRIERPLVGRTTQVEAPVSSPLPQPSDRQRPMVVRPEPVVGEAEPGQPAQAGSPLPPQADLGRAIELPLVAPERISAIAATTAITVTAPDVAPEVRATPPIQPLAWPAQVAWPAHAALPELRGTAGLAQVLDSQAPFARFLDGLAGVRAARDAAALPAVAPLGPQAGVEGPIAARAPERLLLRLEPTRAERAIHTFAPAAAAVASPTATQTRSAPEADAPQIIAAIPRTSPAALRPGALAARAEQLGDAADTRGGVSWGDPAAPAREPGRAPPAFAYVAPATGPAGIARFIDQLVGIEAVRSTASLPAIRTAAIAPPVVYAQAEPSPIAARAPARAVIAAPGWASPATVSAQPVAPATVRPAAVQTVRPVRESPPPPPTFRTGGVAARAEQLAGIVGVRAASLSIDFVDPAGLPALSSGRASPDLAYLWPRPAVPEREAARPPRSTALSHEEWSLVSTFPSAATAVQLAGARQSSQWAAVEGPVSRLLQAAPQRVVVAQPVGTNGPIALRAAERALVRSTAAAPAITAAIARTATPFIEDAPVTMAAPGAPAARGAELERTLMLVGDTPARPIERTSLPGGRQPRGSFTWPGAAGFVMSSERTAPMTASAIGAAEQAAPGTPLWGSMTPVLVQGSLGNAGAGRSGNGNVSGNANGNVSGSVGGFVGGGRRADEESRGMGGVAGPLLELVRSVRSPVDRSPDVTRYSPQPQAQPLVSAMAAGDSASRIVEAVRREPNAGASDDRVTLGDLTLISIASASQQVAASAQGSSPAAPAARPQTESHAAAGGASKKPAADGAAEVEELARKVFEEYHRLLEIARERSGDPWES